MHARRNEDQVQSPFDVDRQPPVGMMDKGRRLECDEEDHQLYRSYAEDHHRERKKTDGKKHFAKMKSRGGAYVQIEIGMMHVMKPPEKRNHVIGPVPPPVAVNPSAGTSDASTQCWKRKPVQQTDMSILRPHCYRKGDWQHG